MTTAGVLVLGAGSCQVPLIRYCRQLGLDVHAVSPQGPCPGLQEADHAHLVDVRDRERILDARRVFR